MPLHLEKKAIRALGVAESFSPHDRFSTLSGIVMRSDLVVDGFAFGRLEVSGSDATKSIISLHTRLSRNDVNLVFLSGSVLSLYNIVDVDLLFQKIKIPVLALTFKKSKVDLAKNIGARFPKKKASEKLKLLRRLGVPQEVKLENGYSIFVRTAGVSKAEAEKALNKFTLQGSIPEPIRVARLLAKAVASLSKRKEFEET